MNSRTWKITSLRDGEAVVTVEGVSHINAVAAIRNAMYGSETLLDARGEQVGRSAERVPAHSA